MTAPLDQRRADRLPLALLAYALALALFLLVPPQLKETVGPPTWFTRQEAADLFTPVVVLPLAWLVLDLAGGLGRRGIVAFLLIAIVWVEGHGIHLAANAIGDVFDRSVRDVFYARPEGDLDRWLDEVLSHWVWHLAYVALALLILWRGRTAAPDHRRVAWGTAALAGFVYGVVFFIVTVQGGTAELLGIPATAATLGWCALEQWRGPRDRVVVTFFVAASFATLIGYAGWAILNHGTLPGFYEVGLVR
jgi:hypothetical protein